MIKKMSIILSILIVGLNLTACNNIDSNKNMKNTTKVEIVQENKCVEENNDLSFSELKDEIKRKILIPYKDNSGIDRYLFNYEIREMVTRDKGYKYLYYVKTNEELDAIKADIENYYKENIENNKKITEEEKNKLIDIKNKYYIIIDIPKDTPRNTNDEKELFSKTIASNSEYIEYRKEILEYFIGVE